MNPWNDKYYKNLYAGGSEGISLHFERGIEEPLRSMFIDLTRWLRKNYPFPVHLNVYAKNTQRVRLRCGAEACGSFCYRKQESVKIPAKTDRSLLGKCSADEMYEMILSSYVQS